MNPVFFELGPLSIRWYGVFAAIAVLVGVSINRYNSKYSDLNAEQTTDITLIVIACGIIGARLFYVVEFWKDHFANNILGVIRIDQGGLVYYGGFLCALLAIFIYCRIKKFSVAKTMDMFCPALAAAHGVSRIGCFLNGCCFGKPTEMFWGFTYPPNYPAANIYPGSAVHPVQLYECTVNLIIFGILQFFIGKVRIGQLSGMYLMFYGTARFILELFRGDNTDFFLNIFSPAQTIGLILVPVGVFIFIVCSKNNKTVVTGNKDESEISST